ncbi:hydrogenase-2 assembly chaperone [Yokenella regensburgei]|jgi:[NiFe] hydrogenase assembly HybE family chaperone|uniref:hydrogenase-2 assembly chaperone n=1 Tax=Yokenella regensburgei TaxID=158877 RepID=UPI0002423112|nr:hydrogenase-2 assembly chaperone [Yokenella regensburgei]EHM47558.1 putative hydrogenase-2 assembly chaperone HybE [Yokenella regensburgei ATCC 43003]
MSDVINGLVGDPSPRLEAAFQAVAQQEMCGLPFFRAHIPVRACGFQLFEQQWIGGMLTPWMLSLLVLPGPGEVWQSRTVGDKLALRLPCGDVRFTVGEMAGCGQYLASSLMSPLENHLTAQQMLELTHSSVRMALSLPVVNDNALVNPGRRALFRMAQRG